MVLGITRLSGGGTEGWAAFLAEHELTTALKGVSIGIELQAALDTLVSHGRPALLEKLKEAGVGALSQRQKLANAVGKEMRSRGS